MSLSQIAFSIGKIPTKMFEAGCQVGKNSRQPAHPNAHPSMLLDAACPGVGQRFRQARRSSATLAGARHAFCMSIYNWEVRCAYTERFALSSDSHSQQLAKIVGSEQVQPVAEIRRVFELLDNSKTVKEEDTFKFGMQVGKLLALGWVLGEVVTSDLALQYEYDDWIRDAQAQEETLRRQLENLRDLLDES